MKALMPLWEIESELEALLNSVEVCEPDLKPELERRIAEYVSAEVTKVDNIAGVLASLETVQANARSEIERLRARQQSAEKAARRLEEYVLRVLREREGRPLKGYNTTFTVRRTEALVITDPEAVPNEWKRTTVTVDIPKDPIKKAIRAGEDIPGVSIQIHEHLTRK